MDTTKSSLYKRVGEEEGINRLVNSFYAKVLADENLTNFFNDTPVERLKSMQKEFFSVALGGPVDYSGMGLSRAHQGRGIRVQHFKRFVDHLLDTLSEFNLTEEERYRIVSEINCYVEDIADDSSAPIG